MGRGGEACVEWGEGVERDAVSSRGDRVYSAVIGVRGWLFLACE